MPTKRKEHLQMLKLYPLNKQILRLHQNNKLLFITRFLLHYYPGTFNNLKKHRVLQRDETTVLLFDVTLNNETKKDAK
jgi:hypothetical protein